MGRDTGETGAEGNPGWENGGELNWELEFMVFDMEDCEDGPATMSESSEERILDCACDMVLTGSGWPVLIHNISCGEMYYLPITVTESSAAVWH